MFISFYFLFGIVEAWMQKSGTFAPFSRRAREQLYLPVPCSSHPQDVNSCQSSPNPRGSWDSCKYASDQSSSGAVCKRSQILCYSYCYSSNFFLAFQLHNNQRHKWEKHLKQRLLGTCD